MNKIAISKIAISKIAILKITIANGSTHLETMYNPAHLQNTETQQTVYDHIYGVVSPPLYKRTNSLP